MFLRLDGIVRRDTSAQEAQDIADNFVRMLSAFSVAWSNDFERSPTKDNYGDLWDSYTAWIGVHLESGKQPVQAVLVAGRHSIWW